MTTIVKVSIEGSLQEPGATIDHRSPALSLAGVGTAWTASVQVASGEHVLTWLVKGAPGATYKVAIDGIADKWSRDDFKVNDQGWSAGFKKFKVL